MKDDKWAYNSRIAALRETEYPMLDSIYLDHAGTTLYSKSLMDKFAAEMTSNLFGNPHSASASSQSSMSRVEDIRLMVLQYFNADPSDFDLVFVANATAGIKLVAEAFRGAAEGFDYAYHQSCHTSLVGVREEARNSQYLDDAAVERWLAGTLLLEDSEIQSRPLLFAYSAQSNMSGQRYPLDWSDRLRHCGTSNQPLYTLLDCASLVATSPLDLHDADKAPDFICLSFYKIFGFPDLGGLIVRRQAAPLFQNRKYFGGGTVDTVVSTKEQWHAPKTQRLYESLEDGTLPIHSIIALGSALTVQEQLYGSMRDISRHTCFLGRRLYDALADMCHSNGKRVCTMYSSKPENSSESPGNGPIVAFNLKNHLGAWISPMEFEKLAVLQKFHIRTGGLCNPGGIASALGLEPWEIKRNFSQGFKCGNETDIIGGKPTGIIRASVGAMSTISDVDNFVAFIMEFYREDDASSPIEADRAPPPTEQPGLYVDSIMVYPIKSCGGYRVAPGTKWEVRPEGLAWDREWCLVHRGTGQALSQKRYPRMALLRPTLDFEHGVLRVSYQGEEGKSDPLQISVPLSANPNLFHQSTTLRTMASHVCGEEIAAQMYSSPEINDFFTAALNVPCALARFPPGGQGKSMRHAKAHLQKHQHPRAVPAVTGSYPELITPPDSDSETERQKILLSNESPILAINLASLEELNRGIMERGGKPASAEVFRANVVIGTRNKSDSIAYSEDHWSNLKIGHQDFKMLGSCRRCHMVCIDQETGEKSQEPFISLTKTRRFEGKVFFGTHMCHTPLATVQTKEAQHPTIRVGDSVVVDAD